MPQFDFHLDGVLHHRKNTEREKQRLLAMVLEQMTQLEAKLRALDAEVQATTGDVREHHLTGKIDLDFLAAHRRYLAATERQAMAIVQKMSVVQRAVDEARLALAAAARPQGFGETSGAAERSVAGPDRSQGTGGAGRGIDADELSAGIGFVL